LVTHYLTRALGTKLFHLHHLYHPSPQLLDALSFLQIHHCRRRVCPVNLSFFISNRKSILPTPELDRGERKYTLRRRSLLSIRRAMGGLPCLSGSPLAFTQSLFPEVFFLLAWDPFFQNSDPSSQSEYSNSRRPRYISIHSAFTGLRKFCIMLYHHPPIEKTHRKRRCVADQSISALNMPPQVLQG
jgi:hypothetical protein